MVGAGESPRDTNKPVERERRMTKLPKRYSSPPAERDRSASKQSKRDTNKLVGCGKIKSKTPERDKSKRALHAIHKVVALASSSRPPLAGWRISAVWSVCIEQLL